MLPVLCGSSWAWLGWVAPPERRQICEKSFPLPPILLRDLISPQAKPSLTWRNRQLSKVNSPSCSVGSNGILILLQGKEGRD